MTIGDIIIIVLIVLYFYLVPYLKKRAENHADKQDIKDISYESEKGKNTATKEDVQVITEMVESTKASFNKSIEQLRADLTKKNIAYEVDYSFYNTERAKSLIELYRKLSITYEKGLYLGGIWKLYAIDHAIDEQVYHTMRTKSVDQYIESLNQSSPAIRFCRFFLDKDFYSKIQEFNTKVINYSNYFILVEKYHDEKKLLEYYDKLTEFADELYDFAEHISSMIQPNVNEK